MGRLVRVFAAVVVAGSLILSNGKPSSASSPRTATGWAIAQTALSYVGYGYTAVGQCTGLVHLVFARFGYNTPYSVAGLWYAYPHIAPQWIQPGDVLIFANTEWAGLSHVAIYLGNAQMVSADWYDTGVRIHSIYEPYFYSRWQGSVRPTW